VTFLLVPTLRCERHGFLAMAPALVELAERVGNMLLTLLMHASTDRNGAGSSSRRASASASPSRSDTSPILRQIERDIRQDNAKINR
jgi:hypothetical protein